MLLKKEKLRKTYTLSPPLIKKTGELVTNDMEKAEVLNKFCLSFHW